MYLEESHETLIKFIDNTRGFPLCSNATSWVPSAKTLEQRGPMRFIQTE